MAEQKIMPTLKAGILMGRNKKIFRCECLAGQNNCIKGFTFIEVLVALAIVSISVLALIKLSLISIRMTEAAETNYQAVLLANEKIEELLALGYPKQGTDSGSMERSGLTWNWRTEVTDLQSPKLNDAEIAGLQEITVDVSWKQGSGLKKIQMSTCVADRKLSEQ
jgi:general secretion pathway protein I